MSSDRPLVFLILNDGTGWAWTGEVEGYSIDEGEGKLDIGALNRLVTAEDWERDRGHRVGGPAPARHRRAGRLEAAPAHFRFPPLH